ncbi:MAG TPA: hypothetical protein PK280_07920 [Planctomycetota bacterium]|nr:hypothetical protein [Planctomycetota bacterium]
MDLAVRIISDAAEAPFPRLMPDEVARLPQAMAEGLKAAGILRPADLARSTSCMACEADHAEWVRAEDGPDGCTRYFIGCPEKGRVEVPVARLQRWAVDFTPVAAAISLGLGAGGRTEVVRPGRLWRLGSAALAGRMRELWLVRDGCSARGRELVAAVPAGFSTLLFRLGGSALDHEVATGFDAVFDASALLFLDGPALRVDREAVELRLARRVPRAMPGRQGRPRAAASAGAQAARALCGPDGGWPFWDARSRPAVGVEAADLAT